MANHIKNGTVSVGAPCSYRNLLSGLEDLLKGNPKVFEVHHFKNHFKIMIVEAGKKAGLTMQEMHADVDAIFNSSR